jgi:hypothetical protein
MTMLYRCLRAELASDCGCRTTWPREKSSPTEPPDISEPINRVGLDDRYHFGPLSASDFLLTN